MAYLRKYYITPRGHVILQCAGAQPGASAAVQYIYTTTISFSHPNNHRISVFGAPMLAPVPPDQASYVLTGPSPAQRASDTNANLVMLRTKFATEFHFTGATGVSIGPATPVLMHFDGFLLTGDGSNANGIYFESSFGFMNIDTYAGIACVGFGANGVGLELGATLGMEGTASDENHLCTFVLIGNGAGGLILGDGSYITMSGNALCFSNGTVGFQLWPRCGAQMDGAVHAICNAAQGIALYSCPTCYISGPLSNGSPYTTSKVWKNASYGIWCDHSQGSGYVDCGAGTGNANGGSISAVNGSMFSPQGGDAGISGACTPPYGVVGNANSLIESGW